MSELRAMTAAAFEAGKLLREYYGKPLTVHEKKDRESVTKADIEAERIIRDMLKEFKHGFWGEESGKHGSTKEYFVVDPLDGTTNFILSNPFFCTAIAHVRDNRVQNAVIYSPLTNDLFVAERGEGAFLNSKRIHVQEKNARDAFIAYCGKDFKTLSSVQKKMHPAHDLRKMGSAGLELAYVAAGRISAFLMPEVRFWDVAAGSLLVEEAEGMNSQVNGKPFTPQSKTLLSAPPHLHERLLKRLKGL